MKKRQKSGSEKEQPPPSEDADVDPLAGPGFGPPFLEKLIMGIIATHNPNPRTVRERLDTAMLALVGSKADPAPFRMEIDYQVDQAVQWIASQITTVKSKYFKGPHWDVRKGAPAVLDVPILPLAREAVKECMPSISEAGREAAAKRVAEIFAGTYDKKLKRGPSGDARRTHIYRAVEHDYVRETVEAQQLRRIGEILSSHGIKTAFDEIL